MSCCCCTAASTLLTHCLVPAAMPTGLSLDIGGQGSDAHAVLSKKAFKFHNLQQSRMNGTHLRRHLQGNRSTAEAACHAWLLDAMLCPALGFGSPSTPIADLAVCAGDLKRCISSFSSPRWRGAYRHGF